MAEQWNYIDKMNTFIAYELQKLTPLEAVLYLHSFRLNNNSNPPRAEWFEVRNVELVGLMRKDPQGIRLLKKSLKEKGFIDFIPGKKGAPTKYSLLPFGGKEKGVNKRGVKLPLKQEKGVKTPPENYPQNYPLNSPESLISCGVKGGSKEKRKENKRESIIKPPTFEDVRAYVEEKGLPIDAQVFIDYYEAGGWKDSKGQPVKNWKQKAITWARHGKRRTSPKKESCDDIDWGRFDGKNS